MCFAYHRVHFCAYCRIQMFEEPGPHHYAACASSQATGSGELGACVEQTIQRINIRLYDNCCVACHKEENDSREPRGGGGGNKRTGKSKKKDKGSKTKRKGKGSSCIVS